MLAFHSLDDPLNGILIGRRSIHVLLDLVADDMRCARPSSPQTHGNCNSVYPLGGICLYPLKAAERHGARLDRCAEAVGFVGDLLVVLRRFGVTLGFPCAAVPYALSPS